MPRVSVVMGIYNTENHEMLEKSVNSILNQTFKDFEFIICDDASTDNTVTELKKVVKDDDRVKIIRNDENKGLAYSLNKCIEIATGEYVARMDADDACALDRFQKQIDFLDKNPEYGVCGSNANLFDDNGTWGIRKAPEIVKKEDFLFNSPIPHPTVIFRKEVLDAVGNYRVAKETLRAEDYDIFMTIFSKGYKIYNIQETLYDVREDVDCFKRRKYKYRIGEAKVRYRGFKANKLLPKGYIYIIKPFIVGLIPQKILKKMRDKKNKEIIKN